ncbi:MAG: FtsW/RodA/SpoVE family cell cycle protein [Phycisphaerae bacterium]
MASALLSRASDGALAISRPWRLTRLGWGLALPVLFLCAVGLACIHVTERSEATAAETASASGAAHTLEQLQTLIGSNTLRQGLFLVTGLGLMLLVLAPSYQKLGRSAYWAYWIVIGLLLLLVIDRYIDLPLIPVKRFTRRWVELGPFSIQPSEFVKVALILALARYLRFRDSYRRWIGLLPPFALTLLPMVLILLQPDLGTLLMLLPVLFSMLFVAGARMRHIGTIIIAGAAILPAFYFYGMQDYQKVRVQVVLKQETADEKWHRQGPGFQLRQSKVALGTGGLWGEGYGRGAFIEHGLLPEEHNDFIFAIIGHQWGFVGALLIVLAYGLIVVYGMEIATSTNDPFGRLLAVGVVVMIVTQAFINIGMTIGLAPITGMTLPFVSYGGSSIWANFIALGLLVNVAQRRPMLIANPPFEHHDY